MQIWEIFLIGVALSMDAFAVAICRGLQNGKMKLGDASLTALFFGGFQALMPTVGYFVGGAFARYIDAFDHWVAFALLFLIGANMIKEAFEKDEAASAQKKKRPVWLELLLMAIATSIDALLIGVTFSFQEVNIGFSAAIIGVTTFLISFIGVGIGSLLGSRFKRGAEITGGLILIGLAVKSLVEGLIG